MACFMFLFAGMAGHLGASSTSMALAQPAGPVSRRCRRQDDARAVEQAFSCPLDRRPNADDSLQSGVARFGRIDRSTLGSINLGVVGCMRVA
jgi:hypothetical protein